MKTSPNAKKTAPKKTAVKAKKTAVKAKKTAATAAPHGRTPAKKFGTRADLGAPVDGFFAKQPPHLVPILEALRALVDEAASDATAAIKWGMPFYSVGSGMM